MAQRTQRNAEDGILIITVSLSAILRVLCLLRV